MNELDRLIVLAQKQGFDVRHAGSGHLKLIPPARDAPIVIVASTPYEARLTGERASWMYTNSPDSPRWICSEEERTRMMTTTMTSMMEHLDEQTTARPTAKEHEAAIAAAEVAADKAREEMRRVREWRACAPEMWRVAVEAGDGKRMTALRQLTQEWDDLVSGAEIVEARAAIAVAEARHAQAADVARDALEWVHVSQARLDNAPDDERWGAQQSRDGAGLRSTAAGDRAAQLSCEVDTAKGRVRTLVTAALARME